MNGTRSHKLICIALLIALCGCEAKTRYQALNFFFDGVPASEEAARENVSKGEAAGMEAGNTGQKQQASTHGPFGAKMCSACHDPNTNTLLLPKEQLCLNCHVLQTGRRQHGPVASGGCVVCHDPHRSPYEHLLVSAAKEFCTYCHDPKEFYAREAHRGVNSSCTECHNPHGSDNDFFLR